MVNETEKSSIFNLSVDEDLKYNMKEIAKWARFLSVVGFVGLGLMVVILIALIINMSEKIMIRSNLGMIAVYFIVGLLYVYPVLTLFKFGRGMKLALLNNDQLKMNASIRSLKNCFQYMGILTIIVLSIYGLVLIYLLIMASTNL